MTLLFQQNHLDNKTEIVIVTCILKITKNSSIPYKIDGMEWKPDVYHLNVWWTVSMSLLQVYHLPTYSEGCSTASLQSEVKEVCKMLLQEHNLMCIECNHQKRERHLVFLKKTLPSDYQWMNNCMGRFSSPALYWICVKISEVPYQDNNFRPKSLSAEIFFQILF